MSSSLAGRAAAHSCYRSLRAAVTIPGQTIPYLRQLPYQATIPCHALALLYHTQLPYQASCCSPTKPYQTLSYQTLPSSTSLYSKNSPYPTRTYPFPLMWYPNRQKLPDIKTFTAYRTITCPYSFVKAQNKTRNDWNPNNSPKRLQWNVSIKETSHWLFLQCGHYTLYLNLRLPQIYDFMKPPPR